LTTEVVLAARTLEQTGKRYFAQSNEEKDKNKDVDNGNVGYVRIDGLREYIKLRPTDPEQLWPTLPSFKSAFDSFYNTNKAIVWNCFVGLAHHLEELDGRVLLKPEELGMPKTCFI
jgi:isopenicillin N synthase-like dioxygenase